MKPHDRRQLIPVLRPTAVEEAFAAARLTVAELESRRIEATCPSWSPAQHSRREMP